MGSKWHWKLSSAQRRMLREVEKDPGFRPPTSTPAADRFWKLAEEKYITFDLDTGDAIVHPKGAKQ